MDAARRPVVISGNSSWNIVNFRVPLIRALERAGFEPVIVAPVDPSAEERMEALGLRRIVADIDRSGVNPIKDLGLLGLYSRVFGQVRPVAYLGYTIKPNIYGCFAARLCRVPAIPNISGLGTAFIRGGLLGRVVSGLYRLALGGARVVFFQNSEDMALFVDRKLVSAKQARLVPGSGIDPKRFAPAPFPSGPFRFLLVARLLGDKGVREFVGAARLLKAEGVEAKFALLGPLDPGNRTAVSQAELDSWIAEGIIEHFGETDDVRPFIADSHVVVLPSYREGLPRALLEGAAMGRPLIATDVAGCRDVVEEGVNGLLCTAHDSQSLAAAMRKMLTLSPQERIAMGEAGRARVQARFSEATVIGAYLDAIGDLALRRG